MSKTLLPPSSSSLEKKVSETQHTLMDTAIPLRQLWNIDNCPAALLPYLAWSFSVDFWDEKWSDTVKRDMIRRAYYIHSHKGTIGAIRRVLEPFTDFIHIVEWWQNGGTPGSFSIEIGVPETGLNEESLVELSRLINDAKPVSRQLAALIVSLQANKGNIHFGATTTEAEYLTVYPAINDIDTKSKVYLGAASHSTQILTVFGSINTPTTSASLHVGSAAQFKNILRVIGTQNTATSADLHFSTAVQLKNILRIYHE